MNKSEFVEYFIEYLLDNDKSFAKLSFKEQKNYAQTVVDTFFSSITESLAVGDRVELRGLGIFLVKQYKNAVNRNPNSKSKKIIPLKKLPAFKMSKLLKNKLIELAKKKK